ncbi:MAG: undecaprenyl-phosphate glucose phosphotransferase [Gammaproteobacteria bacterium]|nr:undecaprenyl-phosphate glucose phosphotransferase [Gammaproteobacteria bacterium]MBU1776702.1 undecaprenyl-phosphate glucose phosphotransferase [Gammaproteobacteria bacterium]MBU1969712.1 undecaprenyl-phosphate glucose phosphotransferase [Gammaproteobacteria bacterium]
MSASDIPVVSFFKRVLDPFITWGVLIVVTLAYDQKFTGYYLVLMITTFFVSSYVYEQTSIYQRWRNGNLLEYIRDTLVGWAIIVAVLLLLNYAADFTHHYSEQVILTWFIATPITLLVSHIAVRLIADKMREKGGVRSAVVVGANETSLKLVNRIAEFPYLLIDIQGYFDERNDDRALKGLGQRLGRTTEVASYARKHNIQMIFISLPMSAQPRIREIIDDLHDSTASVYFLPDVYVFDLMQARFNSVGGIPVVAACESPFSGVDSVVKDVSDFVLALIILILLMPIMIIIALAVVLTSPGPAIFKQRRYGLNGEEIIVYKFRSMTVSEDGHKVVQAQKNDARVTRIGAFLRRTSLDELPQFINVLQGRMSIVGPRPHAVAHNELYRKLIKGYMLRHKVKPGITGWAQINGMRGETEVLEKMQGRIDHDLYYLQNWSLWLDLWIIMRTIWVVLRRDNAY